MALVKGTTLERAMKSRQYRGHRHTLSCNKEPTFQPDCSGVSVVGRRSKNFHQSASNKKEK